MMRERRMLALQARQHRTQAIAHRLAGFLERLVRLARRPESIGPPDLCCDRELLRHP
jgi:hypothetical protein